LLAKPTLTCLSEGFWPSKDFQNKRWLFFYLLSRAFTLISKIMCALWMCKLFNNFEINRDFIRLAAGTDADI